MINLREAHANRTIFEAANHIAHICKNTHLSHLEIKVNQNILSEDRGLGKVSESRKNIFSTIYT